MRSKPRKGKNGIAGMRRCSRCGRVYPAHAMLCQNCHPITGGGHPIAGGAGAAEFVPERGFEVGNVYVHDDGAEYLIVNTRPVENALRLAVVDTRHKGTGVKFFTVAGVL